MCDRGCSFSAGNVIGPGAPLRYPLNAADQWKRMLDASRMGEAERMIRAGFGNFREDAIPARMKEQR